MISNIILFIALSALVTYCIIWFVSVYCNSKLYSDQRISFKKFLSIYKNAPEKVDLYEGRFFYSYWDETCYNTSNKIRFYFSIPDTIRYECWRKEKKREEEKEKADAVMKKVEKLWAKDAVDALWKRNIDNREQEKINVDKTR